ncbi:hypothetical protein HZH68_010279 [Vespula germanica]|uniref:Uncharacterized protein n=1 Tax=Vespula germanica TaxID=30212 RepID=A0A834JSR9_VESGE|nr:hypothetical protein HZH68_010279 [Vespula germanica]
MTVAKRGALSAVAAILVHVTVIRATTAMPRPFNDFYPLANVPHVQVEDEDKDKDEDEEEEEEEEEENEGRIEKKNENVSIVPSSLFQRNSNEPKTSFLQPPPPLLLSPPSLKFFRRDLFVVCRGEEVNVNSDRRFDSSYEFKTFQLITHFRDRPIHFEVYESSDSYDL